MRKADPGNSSCQRIAVIPHESTRAASDTIDTAGEPISSNEPTSMSLLVDVGDRRRSVTSEIVLDPYKRGIAEHFNSRTSYSRSEYHSRLADTLVRLAAPQPDEPVLDGATGAGLLAVRGAPAVR